MDDRPLKLQLGSVLRVAIRHGNAGSTGDIVDCGGGIANRTLGVQAGTLMVTDSIVTTNTAHHGGGLCNVTSGELTLLRTSVTGNTSAPSFGFGLGGGIKNMLAGILTITDSTLSGNASEGSGGAIGNSFSGRFDITNSTISRNTAALNGGGILAAPVTWRSRRVRDSSAAWTPYRKRTFRPRADRLGRRSRSASFPGPSPGSSRDRRLASP